MIFVASSVPSASGATKSDVGKQLISTGEHARELGVARGTILVWINNGLISPEFTTPGGHHRWVLEDVLRQLRDARERDE